MVFFIFFSVIFTAVSKATEQLIALNRWKNVIIYDKSILIMERIHCHRDCCVMGCWDYGRREEDFVEHGQFGPNCYRNGMPSERTFERKVNRINYRTRKSLKTLHIPPAQIPLVSNPQTSVQAPHLAASILTTGTLGLWKTLHRGLSINCVTFEEGRGLRKLTQCGKRKGYLTTSPLNYQSKYVGIVCSFSFQSR